MSRALALKLIGVAALSFVAAAAFAAYFQPALLIGFANLVLCM